LIEASGRCPPEDVGGPWGYAEFLDVIRDPTYERHAELKEWVGCDFDPNHVDNEGLAAHVAALAKQCGALDERSRSSYPHIRAHDGAHHKSGQSERARHQAVWIRVTNASTTPQPKNSNCG
jgi:hypothetical protein